MKKLLLLILALVMAIALAACSQGSSPANNTNNADNSGSNTIKPEDVAAMSYNDYMAAAEGANVVIEGYVQKFAYNRDFHYVSMFIRDDNGGVYYAYHAVCSEDQAAKLAEGIHVKVSGKKASWSGETEVGEGCIFYILEGNKIFEATDISDKLSELAVLELMMNQKIAVKGLRVEENIAADGKVVPFLYNWDGSGAAGANNDLYLTLSAGNTSYTYCVESEEDPENSETYKAVTGLHVGDIIDLEGMLYWYNGPNVHVNSIKVAKASAADTQKSENVLTYDQYLEAFDEEAVIIEGYVQGLTPYNEEYNHFNVYLADADGAYYAKNVLSTPEDYKKLQIGTKVRITGIKASVNGMTMVFDDSTLEILDGYYVAASVNVTDKLGDADALKSMIGKKVVLRDLKIAPTKLPDSDTEYAFILGPDGQGSIDANSDVYFNVEREDGTVCTVCIKTDEQPEGEQTYVTAMGMKIGNEVNLECFICWNDGPELRVQKINVKK